MTGFDQSAIRAFRNHLWLLIHLIIKRDLDMDYICNGNWMFLFLLILEKCILTEISSRNSMSGAGKRQTVCRWFSVTCVFLRTKVWHSCRIYRLTWPRSRWVDRRGQRGRSTFLMPYVKRQTIRCFSRRKKLFSFLRVISHECLIGRFSPKCRKVIRFPLLRYSVPWSCLN